MIPIVVGKLMKIEIKNRRTGEIIIAGEYDSLRAAVTVPNTNLSNADLSKADLSRVDLSSENLSGVNLYKTNLTYSNLSHANLRNADLQWVDLRFSDLRNADLSFSDLSTADLRNVDLREADLRGASLDLSCWPLGCGSVDVIVGARIARQLAYHFAAIKCDDPEYLAVRNSLLDFANKSHLVTEHELPLLEAISIPDIACEVVEEGKDIGWLRE